MKDAQPTHPVAEPLPLVVIAGPTASGKSDLALAIAEQFEGEIVSCDSMQVYRGFDIGTAKLAIGQRRAIPHHLLDIREPEATFSAGDFAREATTAIREIAARGHLAILAGGTGFYLRALLDGLSDAPPRDVALRERLNRAAPPVLHRFLRRLDRTASDRIHPHDRNKLIRAIEICLQSDAPLAALAQSKSSGLSGFRPIRLLLAPPRAALYYRINERAASLFEAGLLAETAALLARGVPAYAQPFQAVGYREARAVLAGELTADAAVTATQQSTRRYAKRQETWFRREPWDRVFPGFGDDPAIRAEVIRFVQGAIFGPIG